jgi:hypothetical protein
MADYGETLYYPYTHFRDFNWLKTAALYYDNINRIVPNGFYLHDGADVEELNKQTGFIKDLDPESSRESTSERFLHFLRDVKQKLPEDLTASFKKQERFKIHPGKITPELTEELMRLGLAEQSEIYPEDFELDADIAALYMIHLANDVSTRRSLSVVSDDLAYEPLIRKQKELNKDDEKLQKDKLDKGFVLASFVIETVVPRDITEVKIDQIAKFRAKYESERVQFRTEMIKLATDVDEVEHHPEALHAYLQKKQKLINLKVEALEEGLTNSNITCVKNMIAISAPSWAISLADQSHNPIYAVAGAGLAASLGFYLWLTDRTKERLKSDYSYVLSLKKNFDTESFFRDVQQGNLIY